MKEEKRLKTTIDFDADIVKLIETTQKEKGNDCSIKDAVHALIRGTSKTNDTKTDPFFPTSDTQPFSYNIKYGVETMDYINEKGKLDYFLLYHCPKIPFNETQYIEELPCFKAFDGVRIICDEPCPFVTKAWYHNMMKRDFLLMEMRIGKHRVKTASSVVVATPLL